MQASRDKRDISSQLKRFCELVQLLGFTTFVYNSAKRRVEYVRQRSKFLRNMLVILQIICIFFLTVYLVFGVCLYAKTIKVDLQSWKETSPIVVQDAALLQWVLVSDFVCVGYLARNHQTKRRLLLSIVNEMLKIYGVLRKRTDSALFVPRSLKVAVTARAVAFVYNFSVEFSLNLFLSVFLVGFAKMYASLLCATTLMGHLYSQLVLICFYAKMTEFLQVACSSMTKEEFSRNVEVLLTISFRIRRVKTKLNSFFSALFVMVYLELSFSICLAYVLWKTMAFGNIWGQGAIKLFSGFYWLCATFFAIIYDLYLVCWLSEELVSMERRFMRDVLLLICDNRLTSGVPITWELNQIMIRSEIFEIRSILFHLVDLDRPFVLNYLFNMVLQYVIMCMQYYIGERHRHKGWKEIIDPRKVLGIADSRSTNSINVQQ